MKHITLIWFLFGVVACGSLTSDEDSDNEQNSSWRYNYEENGCSTGDIQGQGRNAQCEALQDDARNKFCAKSLRLAAISELCESEQSPNVPAPTDTTPGPGPDPDDDRTGIPAKENVCGYAFETMADPMVVKGVLQGTWVNRRPGVLTEDGLAQDRSYKKGFLFGFAEQEIDAVRVYFESQNADFITPVAISKPAQVSKIKISTAAPSGAHEGWHLVQWQANSDRCWTIAVGFERREGELDGTLIVIGPVSFQGAGDVEAPTMDDFFETHTRRDEFLRTSDGLPRWKIEGL